MAIAMARGSVHEIGHWLLQLFHTNPVGSLETGVMTPSFGGHDWYANSTKSKWTFNRDQEMLIRMHICPETLLPSN